MNRLRQQNPLRLHHRNLFALALAVIALCSTTVQAESFITQQEIDNAITHYIAELHNDKFEQVSIQTQPLDSRLKLNACESPLTIEHRPKKRLGGRITVKITCADTASWMTHVPVTIETKDYVAVAQTPIAMGAQITVNDITMELRDVSNLHSGYFQDRTQIAGFIAKRPISSGQILNPSLIDPAKAILRGEKVVIFAVGSGLQVRATGIAMEDGALGDLVRVKNTKTDKVVEGRISAPGQVKVSL